MEAPTPAPERLAPTPGALREVAWLFFRLGCTAFGGPAAHIAMMREEVVRRRQWMSDERFVDLVGVMNLIPGPSSTELAIYLGYLRAGWPGLALAGLCFICPAMLLVLLLAWGYVTYGTLPAISWLFYGIQPAVVAIVTQAIWNLGRVVFKGWLAILVALLVFGLYLLGTNVLILLFGGALLFGLLRWLQTSWQDRKKTPTLSLALPAGMLSWRTGLTRLAPTLLSGAASFSLGLLFLTFLKLGAVIYGSGYTLLAFLHTDLVENLHWLTDQQLLDAVSIGQFTPGPVFTTATFIGYVVGGLPGALLATLGIFLPSFVFVPLIHPLAQFLRKATWSAILLDGLNAAALALMTGVLFQIGQHALIDILTCAIALISFVILLRFKINSFWLILAGAALGVLRFWLLR